MLSFCFATYPFFIVNAAADCSPGTTYLHPFDQLVLVTEKKIFQKVFSLLISVQCDFPRIHFLSRSHLIICCTVQLLVQKQKEKNLLAVIISVKFTHGDRPIKSATNSGNSAQTLALLETVNFRKSLLLCG